ncbi:hypothetical protein PISMIDRAFT_685073 [Pisolithus microcarpus 441]|uniref:Unplaced genomic scaffold scaffold_139, whole genome shotgun sequence n=1 Tax=Pisolithus microcarpus 441 TaxID=765257 RepID=A0A0C9XYQ2_9AGAM|nr:hypothetical protein PISMIDRAFT_685073 [Pisolithus microcarpus 441]
MSSHSVIKKVLDVSRRALNAGVIDITELISRYVGDIKSVLAILGRLREIHSMLAAMKVMA